MSKNKVSKEKFIEYAEYMIFKTIKDYKLIKKKDRIAVAASGGKDSLTALYNVNKHFKNVDALLIDEGIYGYREFSRQDLVNFCKEHKIRLVIKSFKEEFGNTLDSVLKKNKELNPCTFCGIIRRFMINKYSKNYDVVVLGHNLDDEVQSIMMNILRGNLEISSRLGPVTGLERSEKFTRRVKPLYFLTEKEIKIYSTLKGFQDKFVECPYAHKSYRNFVRDFINRKESENPGIKKNIIRNFLKILPDIKKRYKNQGSIRYCDMCGYPSKKEICNACSMLVRYGMAKK